MTSSPSLATVFAKLAAHFKTLRGFIEKPSARYFDPRVVLPILEAAGSLVTELKKQRPDLFSEVAKRDPPKSSGTTDNDGRGYIERSAIEDVVRDLDYIFEVRAGSQAILFAPASRPKRVFISHGRAPDWREVQPFIERDVGLETIELAQQPNRGRTVLQKLAEESDQCSYAVIVMTGDDEVGDDPPRARENVIHEIGFFQGKYGLNRVSLLYEEGTNIPSNIHGLVYMPFPKGLCSASFGTLHRELKDAFTQYH
jgi:predicted nucleotide-binding protein